jgi:AAA+ superfamily predicted ATPase
MLPYGTDKIGSIKKSYPEPIVDDYLWKDFEKEVQEVSQGSRDKTSALFYGLPGNGKTSFVKYLATKYRLPIMILTFDPDFNNHDLLLIFSQIPKKCIVLLEDFDNYYHGRKCIMGGEHKFVKFTFDIILNGLDGAYTTHENVVFIMTVNDISKVDPALRNRPSRFKYTRHFDNPNLNVRKKILPEDWAQATQGLNLDQIFRMAEYRDRGLSLNESLSMLEKDINLKDIEILAYDRFQERQSLSISGSSEDDWEYAINALRLK